MQYDILHGTPRCQGPCCPGMSNKGNSLNNTTLVAPVATIVRLQYLTVNTTQQRTPSSELNGPTNLNGCKDTRSGEG